MTSLQHINEMMIKERKETFQNNWPIMFPNDFLQKFFSQWTSNNWSIIHICVKMTFVKMSTR